MPDMKDQAKAMWDKLGFSNSSSYNQKRSLGAEFQLDNSCFWGDENCHKMSEQLMVLFFQEVSTFFFTPKFISYDQILLLLLTSGFFLHKYFLPVNGFIPV
jgi:hypothetical protein